MKPGLTTFSAALALACLTGAARAETPASLPKITWTAPPAINLADPRLSLASPYAERGETAGVPGMPKTAIDHRFATDNLMAVGYLCGLEPGPNEHGGPASSHDPAGTFLGGQLKLAFK
jgi:hypothetical protein